MAPLPYIFLVPNKLGCCEKSESNSLLLVFDACSIENITVTIYLMFYLINFKLCELILNLYQQEQGQQKA